MEEELPTEISVLTLNCWGLKYISKLRRERLDEIGRQLAIADPQPHIVALQECFTQDDYRSIRRQTRFILPYGKFYHSAAFGGGLAILSRWPIEESTMFRYSLNGRPTAFWRGDWYVGKGVASAKIRYGPGPKHIVEVFNTHTHSPYEHGPKDSYVCHRTAQAWEMSKLLRGAAERGHLVLALGDFNMVPLSLQHRVITAHAPVRDSWRVLHPDSSLGPADLPAEKARRRPIPTAEFNLRENGAASDGPYNTWRWPKAQQKLLGPGKSELTVAPDTIDIRGKRLDYIFASTGDVSALGGGWVVRRINVGMTMRHPELGCSLSDHFAVEATLVFQPVPSSSSSPSPSSLSSGAGAVDPPHSEKETAAGGGDDIDTNNVAALHNGTYLQSPTASSFRGSSSGGASKTSLDGRDNAHIHTHTQQQQQLLALSKQPPPLLPSSSYDEMLAQIHFYVRRERSQRTWRGRHFFAWLAVTIGCLVAVWFSPHNYVSFILMLVSSLGLTAGTIDGLLSLLFFRSELQALKEYEWEIRNAKAAAAAGGGEPPVPVLEDGDDLDDREW
ncbi:Endonuclease/exonuclease/phosphatase [Bombardia bombarda]|uniref:Endonuclease/exonuclease/phosphatase n=1 Tax=Bombardia bombarda TaxID=252184 RepID=A0AA39WN44_9PEZI|nr:Endonuclease/exonuclease/phosphatase [Bombardia bombarda]